MKTYLYRASKTPYLNNCRLIQVYLAYYSSYYPGSHYSIVGSPKSERLYRDPREFQDDLCDILRKTEVSFVSVSCIVQILWQYQVIIEKTVPIFVI